MSDQPAWLKPHGRGWRVQSGPDVRHDNPWFAVEHYKAEAPTGFIADYYKLNFKNIAAGVVPLHEDGTVSLVGQWRFPFGAYSWEIPEGGVPQDETPLDGIRRELREEAGLEAADWRLILTMQLSNSSSNEVAYCYLATGLSAAPGELDPTESLAVQRAPFTEAFAAVLRGEIQDSMTVASLLRIHHMAVTGELAPALAARVLGRQPEDAL